MRTWDQIATKIQACSGDQIEDHPDPIWFVTVSSPVDLPPAPILVTSQSPADSPERDGVMDRAHHRRTIRRSMQALVAAAALGCAVPDLDIDRSCPRCGDLRHGPPVASAQDRRLHLRSASVGDLFTFALATSPFGLDLVADGTLSDRDVRLARRSVDGWTTIEGLGHDAVSTWAALEAIGKATGIGLAASGRDVERALDEFSVLWFHLEDAVVAVATRPDRPTPSFLMLDCSEEMSSERRSVVPYAQRPAGAV